MISSHCFSQLAQTLRHANRRYTLVALFHRSTLHLTHHAKRTASHLRIDTRKALGCPIHLVSRQPLPLLESLSPLVPVRTTTVAMQGSTQAMDAGVDAMVSTALKGLHYSYPELLMYSDVPTPAGLSSCGSLTTLTKPDVYPALRIIIPARNNKKRKWQDAQIELDDEDTHRAKNSSPEDEELVLQIPYRTSPVVIHNTGSIAIECTYDQYWQFSRSICMLVVYPASFT
ncbi:hypothetical protein EDD15DRAFT_2196761 [Pisolithus albus]|nr:hypothetical protein EDD15DRAFT_2196761 [Pisolithus albus]